MMFGTHGIQRRRGSRVLIVATLLTLGSGLAARAQDATSAAGPQALARLTRDPMLDSAMGKAPNVHPSATGAMDENVRWEAGTAKEPFIEEQQAAFAWVQLGLTRHTPKWRATGWHAFKWAFDRENTDGLFIGRDQIQQASLLLEAAARSLLLEREDGAASEGEQYLPDMLRTARAIAARNPDTDPEVMLSNPLSHRYWLKAAALGDVSRLTGDKALAAAAVDYARRGLAAQRPDGVNPERGGYDVGYQAAGVLFAARYVTVCDDAALRAKVLASVHRGALWLADRQLPDGSLDATGSTRVLHEKGRNGRVKPVFYGIVAEALAAAAYLTRDPRLETASQRLQESEAFKTYYLPKSHPARPSAP